MQTTLDSVTEIETIAKARNITGITWSAIAVNMGVSIDCLFHWRRAKTKVPLYRWQALATAIGVPVDNFCRKTYNIEFAEARRKPDTTTQPAVEPLTPPTPPKQPQAPSGGLSDWFGAILGDD